MKKTDCYWYAEEHDMNARIPYCKLDPTNPYDQVMKCNSCKNYHSKWRPTNADKIRTMSDEELVLWFMDIQGDVARYYCGNYLQAPELPTTKEAWIKWLRSESEGE